MIDRFFIILGLSFLFSLSVQAKDIRFVQVAETMFTEDNKTTVEQCIDDINTLKNVDFVIFTGDNIANANKDTLKDFLSTTKKIKFPVYFVIGDRDVSKSKGLTKETYREEVFKYYGLSQSLKPNYYFKKKGLTFVVVDGAKEFVTATNGYFKQDTLDWLDKVLDKNARQKVVIIQHFPVLTSNEKENNTYKVELYEELLKKHTNIMAIVCAHFNENKEVDVDNISHFLAPSFSKTKNYKIFDIPETKDFIFTQLRHVE